MESFYVNDKGCESEDIENQKIIVIKNPNTLLNSDKLVPYWNKYKKLVLNNIENVCKGGISAAYLDDDSFNDVEYLILLFHLTHKRLRYDRDIESETLMGFILANTNYLPNGEKSLYVDVLCSNTKPYNYLLRGGKILLNEALNIANNMSYNYLELSSISQVLSYYRKLGFSHYDPVLKKEDDELNRLGNLNLNLMLENMDEVTEMILIEKALKVSHVNNELNEELLRENLKTYLNLEELPDDETILNYLSLVQQHVIDNQGNDGLYDYILSLIKHKYSKDCKNLDKFDEEDFLKKDEYNNYYFVCGDNGFNMKKIIDGTTIINCSNIKGGKNKYTNIYIKKTKTPKTSETYKSQRSTQKKHLKTHKHKKLPWSGWKNEKPTTHERTIMLKECGKECFLGPNKSFPICTRKTCKINDKGVYAAYVRAREWGKKQSNYMGLSRPTHKQRVYQNVARKAKKILTRKGYKNVGKK